jgi:hypothetical protein
MPHSSVLFLTLCVLALSSCTLLSSARAPPSPLSRLGLQAQTGNLTRECYSDPKCTVPDAGGNDTVVIGQCYEHSLGEWDTRAQACSVEAALNCRLTCGVRRCVFDCQVTTPIPFFPCTTLTHRLSVSGPLAKGTGLAGRQWTRFTIQLQECAIRTRHASLHICRWRIRWKKLQRSEGNA